MPDDHVDRTVQFFQANRFDDYGDALPLEHEATLQEVLSLPFSGNGLLRYLDLPGGDALCAFRLPFAGLDAFQFSKIRRGVLPRVELFGEMEDLELKPGAGLEDSIHIVFFPGSVIGAEYNQSGPRVSQLGAYFSEKAPHRADGFLNIRPKLTNDIRTVVDDLEDLRLFRLVVHPSYEDSVRQRDASLANLLRASDEYAGTADTDAIVEQRFGRGTFETERALQDKRETILDLIDPDLPGAELIKQLTVKGRRSSSGRVEEINLLGFRLVSKQAMLRVHPKSRAVDPLSAVTQIRQAHESLLPQMEGAPSVSPD